MARPLLADPDFVHKAARGRADEINTCIACNQACLDHTFSGKIASLPGQPARLPRDRARLSADRGSASASRSSAPARPGSPAPTTARRARPRGRRCSTRRARSAASSTWPSASPARRSSHETLRYFRRQLELTGVDAAPRTPASTRPSWSRRLRRGRVATGVAPRDPRHPGHRPPEGAVSYLDVLRDGASRSASASRSSAPAASASTSPSSSPTAATVADAGPRRRGCREWGVDTDYRQRAAGCAAPERRRAAAHACTCCSARPARSAPGSARPPAGSTAPTLKHQAASR